MSRNSGLEAMNEIYLVKFQGFNRHGVVIRNGNWEFTKDDARKRIETLCKSLKQDSHVMRILVDIAIPRK